ncbi:MAG: ATP-binding protein [Methanothrix sp.]|jgi:MinD superfamily P-loop ATPase|uniref:Iron sulfur cluster/nucleotide binding domain protein n=1 Tax=Methanothrix harundinacea TaxID=301375 RepID=A0A101FUG8_9EURY|nr:MAG: (4Fe-4S)-binding protein [Methanosaeta sp. SDB]KUK44735.1 MAG: Iron sulfur cluster/nucleotide binding domain protein [Methanothrix harundinacea]MDD3710030.1 ATP-binding protein [Methanothrix sp.]MDI9399031.1 ATP-binding protein [Euryarchaeota archaeon]KUK95932.1 MAG: Iron sulfur cluster/nucleotide binding domain protein [Methanothrix harundinacea]
MIISVASGKGGTGKTLVTTNLAASIGEVELVDCDVEEPNSYLFFPNREGETSSDCTVKIPVIDEDKCTRCGRCSEFCAYNALAVFPQDVLLFKELCHGCGGCVLICPEGAISEGTRPIGKIFRAGSGDVRLLWGELNVGEPMATPLIRSVKAEATGDLVLIDSPPGTACPVIEAVRGSDFCLLVTEPTPFGLYDLSIAVQVVREMEIPCGVVVNRSGMGDRGVYDYCEREEIPILLEIPMKREIAEFYSRGVLFSQEMTEWQERFAGLIARIEEAIR